MNVFDQALLQIKNALAYIRKDHNGYYRFGEDDCLPNGILRVVNDSGTGRSCITKLSQFIQANGLVDQTVGATPANKEQTFNSVIAELSLIVSYFKCSSYRVMFNNSGEPAIIYPVPTQKLRRLGRTKFLYNDLMGEAHRMTREDKYLQAYDKDEPIQARMARISGQIEKYGEQFGDIIYHFKKGVGLYQDVYPVPDYYSGIDDIESDAGISRLELRNIKKGWRTPIIVAGAPIDKVLKDDKNKTAWDYFSDDMKKFTGEDAAYALYLSGATPETLPKVTVIPIADILDQTDKATDRLGRKVCRIMGVPPILVGFSTAGQLGNNEELLNTMNLFKMTVIESQDLIKESLRIVFPDKNWDLTTLNLWETVKPTPNEAGTV
jgi:hypothetical protein